MSSAAQPTVIARKARLLDIIVVALRYFVAACFGLALAFEKSNASPVWPPSGIAFAATLIFGLRVWPGIAAGALAANIVVFARNEAGPPASLVAASLLIAAGNTLEAVSGALLARRLFASRDPFESARDVFKLVLAALLMCLVSAAIGPVSICALGLAPWSALRTIWVTWWLGDVAGVIILTPLLVSLHKRSPSDRAEQRGSRLLEASALIGTLALVGSAVFLGLSGSGPARRESYLLIPILLWAVFRFGRRAAAVAVTATCAIAIWGTAHGYGPFSGGSLNESLLLLQAYVCVVSLITMSVAALIAERRRTEEELRSLNDSLESRIRERTADVDRANEELRKANDDLEERSAELHHRNEDVEAFVYSVSHDLRAPLVNIQGFSRELEMSFRQLAELLRDATLAPDVQKTVAGILDHDIPLSIRFILAGTSRSERLINALLLLSRSGREQLRFEVLDMEAIARATLDSLRKTVEGKGAEVTISGMPKARGDATAIGRVLANLLANAVNYLRPGTPGRIEIGGEEKGASNEYWVRDNGAGLSGTARGRLFLVFQRFHPKLADGEGMGLAIVKRIVERHGGRVWADSEEGNGSTFRFSLPNTEQQ